MEFVLLVGIEARGLGSSPFYIGQREKMLKLCDYIDYRAGFVTSPEGLYSLLLEKVNWRQDKITLFGKTHPIPRFHAWYGDEGANYSYSGVPLPRNDWFEELFELKESIEKQTGLKFNGVLANLYRDGKDSNGWHADDEKELVRPINVASLSLGEERDCQFREIGETRVGEKIKLENGSLLVMKAPCQHHWQHQIPKRSKAERARLNFTFRLVKVE